MKPFHLALAAAALFCAGSVTAQQKSTTPATKKSTAPLKYESAVNDPLKARIYTLDNGLKVYLSVYKNAPRIQTYIAVKAGSKNDPSNATGLAHYLEHMVFKGTDKYGTKDYAKESAEISKIENLFEVYRQTKDETQRKTIYRLIDSISGVAAKYAIANEYDKMLASIGADGTNAFTSFDMTVYVNDIPGNQVSNWLKIEAERFHKPVLRLFHTELEAVYEEKNRGLDNDGRKMWEALFEDLFHNHTYGTQTTIGTIEHLKNPSMLEIRKYYDKYYVPNNMAIIMSGDFNPDEVIKDIAKNFGSMKSAPVQTYTFNPEPEQRTKKVHEILGPDPATMMIGWRVAGEGTPDADMCMLISGMLSNGVAGLFDLNLNQAQKVLSSFSEAWLLKDYGLMCVGGDPKEGQSLEDVESLLYGQIDLLKRGEFPDWLPQAVVTDLKLKKTRELESNNSRASVMLDAYVNGVKWQDYVNKLDRISKITKQQIMDYAKKNLNDNYVVIYKRNGEDNSVQKVQKPSITPVDVDRDNSSEFVKEIQKSTPPPIEPKFIDYNKDITHGNLKSGIPLLYNKNTENNLFSMYYRFTMGSNSSPTLPVAIKCIPYLSATDMSAVQVKEELYKLGCSFNVFSGSEDTWVLVDGLSDNFAKAMQLFENVLAHPVVEQSVLQNVISDIIKERNDNKMQKRVILNRAMTNYARYGSNNPFSNVLSEQELKQVTPTQIRDMIAGLTAYEHQVLYYGPSSVDQVTQTINKEHLVPAKLTPVPAPKIFPEKQLDRTVYVVDYDMKQAEIMMLSNGDSYKPEMVPIITLYNNYFGGGMSSVLFQDLRESKALAYSTYAQYMAPNKLWKKYYNMSYIGSQADKLGEAMKGLSDLLDEMPKAEGSFSSAKEMILQEMRTQRINRADILFNYLSAQDLGNKTDIRRDIFSKVQTYQFEDVKKFHDQNIKGKPMTVLVLGKKDLLDASILSKYGEVKFLKLEEIFGY